jgi:tetratricopeptide (TPR) repeat protein
MDTKIRASMLVFFLLLIDTVAPGQTTAPGAANGTAPGLIRLTGDDEKRAKQLDEQIGKAMEADCWDEAIARAEELLALRKRVQGPRHFEATTAAWNVKTLRRVAPMAKEDRAAYFSTLAMSEQGAALVAQGNYAQAQTLFQKALGIRRRLLTDEQPSTAECYNNLAVSLDEQANYVQAQPLLEKALEIRRRLLTEDHKETVEAYNNLAYNLNAQGKYDEAQRLYEKALEIGRRLFSDDSLEFAASCNSLAFNLDDQGKYASAQSLYEKALEIRRKRLSDNHPDTARCLANLACNLDSQGKFAAAEPMHEKALAVRRRLLTDDHPETAGGFASLATNLISQGKYAQAQPLLEKALEVQRRLLTDDHPTTATCYNNLALNLDYQGKYAEAQPLYEQALEIHRRVLGDNHPNTATSFANLAHNLKIQGKPGAAQPLFEKALEIFRRALGDDHPDTAESYNDLGANLDAQGKHSEAQPLLKKGLAIQRRLMTDDNPRTARSYNEVANNLGLQGKYVEAQPLYVKAVATQLRLRGGAHPETAMAYNNLATDLNAQGKYGEARDEWRRAVESLDGARLRLAFVGIERGGPNRPVRLALAAVLARLGAAEEAWQRLEEDSGRGLLDELAARKDRRLAPGERTRLSDLTRELERLDRLAESTPRDLDEASRAKRFDELKHQRDLASIALGEFQSKLASEYGPLAGQVISLHDVQSALAADTAVLAWVDLPPAGPSTADPDGEHWCVVVRSRGIPNWIAIRGTGSGGLWTKDDIELAPRVRKVLQSRPAAGAAAAEPLLEKFRIQRLAPLDSSLDASGGLPRVRRFIVLPSRALAGIPIEAFLAPGDSKTVSYAPSATVFKYLREQSRSGRSAGLLALGDPDCQAPVPSSEPAPLPERGLLIKLVGPGSNAATHGVSAGDVLLTYNGNALSAREDLKPVADPGKPVPVEIWRSGRVSRRELAPGKLGVVIDARPAPVALADERKLQKVLTAARSGDEHFASLPGTRYEVEAIAKLFRAADRPTLALLGTDASEPKLDRLSASGELRQFGYIHLATHGLIDEAIPQRSAIILSQTGLPDPLEQLLNHKQAFDGRLTVREIQRTWELKAELVTLSACETALGREAGGEGFVGFTQALLMSGARSVCLSLWKVDDTATALLMQRFYANILGRRTGLSQPMPKADALAEAKAWLRELRGADVVALAASLSEGEARAKGAEKREEASSAPRVPIGAGDEHPYRHPYYWAAFVLVGDPG